MLPLRSRLAGTLLCCAAAFSIVLHAADTPADFHPNSDFEVQRQDTTPVYAAVTFGASQTAWRQMLFGSEFPGAAYNDYTPGPDGRLYGFVSSVAFDRRSGGKGALRLPGETMITRMEPDGSQSEIFCRGLREPHTLAFDDLGNLFTTDVGGGEADQGRCLYLVEGGDYGWRPTLPRLAPEPGLAPARVPWSAEKPWAGRFDDRSALILPPAANVAAGSWGLAHYPGTGFLPRYDDHFFASNPTQRKIFSWSLRPNGAGFLLVDQMESCTGCPAKDMAFRPGDRLEFTLDETVASGNAETLFSLVPVKVLDPIRVEEVKQLLGGELVKKSAIELKNLLQHPDQRVRLAAEWRLVAAPDADYFLREVALSPSGGPQPTVARLHAVWGLGILARRAEHKTPGTGAKIVEPLVPLLDDDDLEVRVQAAQILGDAHVSAAFDGLIRLLRNPDERASMYAARALGKLGNHDALPQILLMLQDAADHDPNLRHAYVGALVRMHDFDALEKAAHHDSPAVRRGALLAMNQLHRAEVALFLHDEEPALVRDAIRAIHDENIESALPQLAALIKQPVPEDALMCRILNANFRIGEPANARALATYAARPDAPEALRLDALKLLAGWSAPPSLDYLNAEPQDLGHRPAIPAQEALESIWPQLEAEAKTKSSNAGKSTILTEAERTRKVLAVPDK